MLFKVKLARDECDKRLETLLQEIGIKKERLRQYIASETSGSEEETLAKALDAAIDDETAQENVVNEAWRELEEAKESEEALKDEVSVQRALLCHCSKSLVSVEGIKWITDEGHIRSRCVYPCQYQLSNLALPYALKLA